MKRKKIFLLLILWLSLTMELVGNYTCENNELSKIICRCECFHVDYVETCLILFLIAIAIYYKYKLIKSEARQEWMRKELKIDSKKIKNAT